MSHESMRHAEREDLTDFAEGRSETVSEVCGFHCPACGNDGVAFMLEGRIVALPHAPALRCQHCETEFRIALYAAEGRGSPDRVGSDRPCRT